MKFTKYTVKGAESVKAFSNVVLTTFSYTTPSATNTQTADAPAKYTLDLNYDPAIFSIINDVELKVPSEITTRSAVDKPTELFAPVAKGIGGTN